MCNIVLIYSTISTNLYYEAIDHFVYFTWHGDPKYYCFCKIFLLASDCPLYQIDIDKYEANIFIIIFKFQKKSMIYFFKYSTTFQNWKCPVINGNIQYVGWERLFRILLYHVFFLHSVNFYVHKWIVVFTFFWWHPILKDWKPPMLENIFIN